MQKNDLAQSSNNLLMLLMHKSVSTILAMQLFDLKLICLVAG